MRLLVIGASGRSGQLVIEEALRKDHLVTALVRKPTSLPKPSRDGLTVVSGTPLNESDIRRALAASPDSKVDAVLFTMSARRTSDSPFSAPDPVDSPPRLLADSTRNTIAAMRSAEPPVRKIIVMSSVGTGESMANVNLLMRLTFAYTNMKHSREDHEAVYDELRKARARGGIEYVAVRPWMLTDAEVAPVNVYPDDGEGAGFMPKISRASVARLMVEAAESSVYDGRSPVITN